MKKEVKEMLSKTEVFIELNEDRILLVPDKLEEKTKGGIIIPDEVRENNPPQRGTIISVGPGTEERPVTYKPGQRVMYGKYSGTEVTHKKIKYMIMRNQDIVGKILIEDPESSL